MSARNPTRPRFVLAGCGEIGTLAHLPALSALSAEGALELAAVCDADSRRAEEAARRFGVAVFGTDWRRLARQTGADAISVCLPPGPNAQVAVEAVREGLHVLCEKPPGRNAAEALLMAEAAAERPDRVTMVAFNRRFAPLYRRARERSEAIGRPQSFFARFTRGAIGQEPSNTVSDWVSSDGSHALDLALATMGSPELITVARRGVGSGPDNVWMIQLENARGVASVWLDFAAGRRLERFEWAGPGYDVLLTLPDRGEWAQRGTIEAWAAADVTGSSEYFVNYGFLGEYRAFSDAVAGRGPRPEADFAYGHAFLRLVEEVLASRSGETRRFEAAAAPPSSAPRPSSRSSPAGAPSGRSVVAVLQPPDAVRKYFPPEILAELSRRCEVRLGGHGASQELLSGAHAVVLGWGAPPLTSEALASAPELALAVVLGASVRWALPPSALAGGLTVCNTADAIAQSVAEHCLLLSLAGLRRLTEVDRAMHRGAWPPQPARGRSLRRIASRAAALPGLRALKARVRPAADRVLDLVSGPASSSAWNDLRGQTVGLVGWGHTARRFAELLAPFDCTVLVCSEHADETELARFGARRASLGEAVASARVVSLHKGLTDRTRGLLSGEVLDLLAKGAVLVNTARAELVDEEALLARARRGDIVAALDVFHREPLPRKDPLRALPNVILSPHSASTTPQCARRVGEQALRTLLGWAAGEPIEALPANRLAAMS